MKKCIGFLFLLNFILSTTSGFSIGPEKISSEVFKGNFVENKGQIRDQQNNQVAHVNYLLSADGLNVQIRKKGFSYDLFKYRDIQTEDFSPKSVTTRYPSKPFEVDFHRIDIDFEGANPNASLKAGGKSSTYFNYYTSTQECDSVFTYQRLLVKDLYSGIDLEYLSTKEGFKYNFILHPGSNLNDIRIRYTGAPFKLNHAGIEFFTSLGLFSEELPASWFEEPSGKVPTKIMYKMNNDSSVGFIADYTSWNSDLIIDPLPNRAWGTYFGGTADDEGKGVCTDRFGNIYFTGFTRSTANIATVGSHNSVLSGFSDAFLVKFNAMGQLLWGTYYGGSNADFGEEVCTDSIGSVFLVGTTRSSNGISTIGSHQVGFGGGDDGFLAKFSSQGTRIWATYLGGVSTDNALDVCLEDSGNLYVCGTTNSTTGISFNTSYQPALSGTMDAFLVKFSPSGVRLWGTYYGGNNGENGSAVCLDRSGNIYLAGDTYSSAPANSIATAGSHQSSYSNNSDGFLVKFSGNGTRIWATYYGGPGQDGIFSLAIDSSENIFATGFTDGDSGIATPGSYQAARNNFFDGFLVKFSNNGVRQWGTYYGGELEDISRNLSIHQNAAYISGYTQSTTGISTTGSFKTTLGGTSDAYLAKFTLSGSRDWGTYFGGTGTENGDALTLDGLGNIYLGGTTKSSFGIATPGAHMETHNSFSSAFLTRMNSCDPVINTDSIRSVSSEFCRGKNYVFRLDSPTTNAIGYYWSIPAGWTILSGQNSRVLNVVAGPSGVLKVRGYNSCGDSSKVSSKMINAWPELGVIDTISLLSPQVCPNKPILFGLDTVTEAAKGYLWSVPAGWTIVSGQTTAQVNVLATGSGTLSVKAYNNCGDTTAVATKLVNVPGSLGTIDSIKTSSNSFCTGKIYVFTLDSPTLNASGYFWRLPSGWIILNGQHTKSIIAQAGSSGSVSVKAYSTCGDSTQSSQRTILVTPALGQVDSIRSIANQFCSGSVYQFRIDTPTANAAGYHWNLPQGWTLMTGQGTTQISVIMGGSGTLSVRGYSICGDSSNITQRAIISSPVLGTLDSIRSVSNTFCGNNSYVFKLDTPTSNAIGYLWETPSGWIIQSGQGTPILTVIPSATGTLRVRAFNSCGDTSLSQIKTVVVVPPLSFIDSIRTSVSEFCINKPYSFRLDSLSENAIGYLWTVPSGWVIQGGQNTSNFQVTPTSSGLISVKAFNVCGNYTSSSSRQITVIPQLGSIDSIQTIHTTFCKDQPYVFRLDQPSANAAGYWWTVPSGWTIVSGQMTRTLTVLPKSSGSISVRAFSSCGDSSAVRTKGILVQLPPGSTDSIRAASSSICENKSHLFSLGSPSANATGYEWTTPPNWTIISGQGTQFVNLVPRQSGLLKVRAYNSCGDTSIATTQFITTIPQLGNSVLIKSTDSSYCINKSYTFQLDSPVANASGYIWTFPQGWQVIGSLTGAVIALIPNGTGLLQVRAFNDCGDTTPTVSKLIEVNALGVLDSLITFSTTFCANDTHEIRLKTATNNASGYWWTLPHGWQLIEGQGGPSIRVKASLSGTVRVKAYSSCGDSSAEGLLSRIVLVNPNPPATLIGSDVPCIGTTESYRVPIQSGINSYQWSKNGNWIGNSNSDSISITFFPPSDTLRVRAIGAGGCISEEKSKFIEIGQVPGRPQIVGPIEVVSLGTAGFKAISANSTGFSWSASGGWTILNGQGTDSIWVKASTQLTNLRVEVQNNCGTSSDSLQVDVLPSTGIAIVKNFDDLIIYPNPTKEKINIEGKALNSIDRWKIYNQLGQEVLFGNLILNKARLTIDLVNLSSGVYQLSLEDDKGRLRRYKFILSN
ncbi:hypothetical protein MASR2M44_20640 [Bacteroidota bacterium]